MILPVVLAGCEICSLTLRRRHRLKILENMVLKNVVGHKSVDATWEWRKLRYEELHHFYF